MEPLAAGDPSRIGDYAIRSRLGQGAMGVVYLGRSPGGRLVAVKVARAELADDAGFRERFRHEVAMARAVGGFWTAAVVDADPDAARPWLATEYVPGPTLREVVAAYGPLPEPAVRRLAVGLAEALLAIHSAGMVHRDLKPGNVLLAADGPRVIDFGIAKALEAPGLTATGVLVGTPGFLSPEQVEGRELTPASDVFALGSVLVYAATGHGPYGDGDLAALMYRVVHGTPHLAGVPQALWPLVERCLDRDPANRPTTAAILSEVDAPDADDWLPDPVRTLVVSAPSQERRTPTRPYTKVAEQPRPPAPPPAQHFPPPQPAQQPQVPPPGPAPAGVAHFATSRLVPLLLAGAYAVLTVFCGSASGLARDRGNLGGSFEAFVLFVLFAVLTVRYLWRGVRPTQAVEVSAAGLTASYGDRRIMLRWAHIARVRIVAQGRRGYWLVVWPADPTAARRGLGPDFPPLHGGFRVYPLTRPREVAELRAALSWYGRQAYDPS